MRPDQLQLGFLKVLPGTLIEKRQDEYGIKHMALPPYEVLETRLDIVRRTDKAQGRGRDGGGLS